ncbi:MAG TPA: thioredoxin domain-containing protein, partial [Gemmatimonadales bacterium]|nr:thioredoxin domain-containing protein [Gemmatimonadales bacterium]
LNRFDALLGVIALAGGAWLWVSARSGGPPALEPIPPGAIAAAADFPGYVLGDDSAAVEVVEYADFQCPACAQFAVLTMHDVRERLIQTGRVRWRFRDFPLDMHDKARLAHHAAACAAEQNQFWAMHDQLYYGQARWSRERASGATRMFRDFGRAVGLDLDAYDACMNSGRFQARIEASVQEGVRLGVGSTPTFVFNGTVRVAEALPYDAFRRVADSLAALK